MAIKTKLTMITIHIGLMMIDDCVADIYDHLPDNKGGQKNAQEKYLYIRFTVVKSGEGRGAEGSILK
eukprot:8910455-Prorocentrum_lima.AAC.1